MKKFYVVVLAVIMSTFMLTGCGSSAAKTSTSEETTTADTTTEEATTEATSKTSNDVAADATTDTTTCTSEAKELSGTPSKMLQKCREQGYIVFGTGNDIPFAFVNESTGEADGIDPQIMKEAMHRLGVDEIKWKVMDWSVLLQELQTGNTIDMVVDGLYIKPERQAVVDFCNPVYWQADALAVLDDSTIASKDDLKGKNVGTITGWGEDQMVSDWVTNGICGQKTLFANQTECILALQTGSIDAAAIDGAAAAYMLQQNSSLGFHLVKDYKDETGNVTGYAVAFGNTDFLAELNGVIDDMKNDGTMAKIVSDWGLPDSYNLVPAENYQTTNSATANTEAAETTEASN